MESDTFLTGVEVHSAIIEDRLRDACCHGDLDNVKSILEGEAPEEAMSLLQRQNGTTGTPIMDAMFFRKTDIIKYLLTFNVDLEEKAEINIFYPIFLRDNCSALSVACAVGDLEIVRLLLDKGADVNHASHASTPLLYACEHGDPSIVSTLLDQGADPTVCPPCAQAATEVVKMNIPSLAVYKACLNGQKDTATILMAAAENNMSSLEREQHLQLLGAQTVVKYRDYETGTRLWQEALTERTKHKSHDISANTRVTSQSPTRDQHCESHDTNRCTSVTCQSPIRGQHCHICQIFSETKEVNTVKDLLEITSDNALMDMHALHLLETLLGPTHPESTELVSQMARQALQDGNLAKACGLFYHTVSSNESLDHSNTAAEYSAHLADMLLNIHSCNPANLTQVQGILDVLVGMLNQVSVGMAKMVDKVTSDHTSLCDPVIKIIHEQTETFMAYLRLLMEYDISHSQMKQVQEIIHRTLLIETSGSSQIFSIEAALFGIAVSKEYRSMSTLYFYKEEIFPHLPTLVALVSSRGNVNCQDKDGNTPLHHALDTHEPDAEIIQYLLDHGAHVDITDTRGVTPYSILRLHPQLGIRGFDYLTLKCFASRVLSLLKIPYKGLIPKTLESFVKYHEKPRLKKSASCGKLAHLSIS